MKSRRFICTLTAEEQMVRNYQFSGHTAWVCASQWVRKATAALGQTWTKPHTCPPLPNDSFTPIVDEKINQIKTVALCQSGREQLQHGASTEIPRFTR